MTELTAGELAETAIAPERAAPRRERGPDWPLAIAFFTSVLAMYATIGVAVYSWA